MIWDNKISLYNQMRHRGDISLMITSIIQGICQEAQKTIKYPFRKLSGKDNGLFLWQSILWTEAWPLALPQAASLVFSHQCIWGRKAMCVTLHCCIYKTDGKFQLLLVFGVLFKCFGLSSLTVCSNIATVSTLKEDNCLEKSRNPSWHVC